MPKQVYSFTKIEKKRTKKGVIALVLGMIAIVALIGLIVAAVVLKGQIPMGIASMAYLSLLAAVIGWSLANEARKNDDSFGRCIESGRIVSIVAVILHIIFILIGIMSIIM